MHTPVFPIARRMPGSNNYDNILVDIATSFEDVREWLRDRRPINLASRPLLNRWNLGRSVINNRMHIGHSVLGMPIHDSGWFKRFQIYWSRVLGGSKIDLCDFFHLRSVYRQRCEAIDRQSQIEWGDATSHLANWQHPANLFHTLHFAFKDARVPVKGGARLARLTFGPGKRALEFGCGLAPMYASWRRYFNHVPMQWTILDIENFPFHYACHLYGADSSCECVPITATEIDHPLTKQPGLYDVIFCQEVFEHSHAPLKTAEYLLDHLAPGGLLYFDYMQSDGHNLDTPAGVDGRQETLAFLTHRLHIVHPRCTTNWDFQALTVGVKRS
jgi:hypothetical protein